MPGGFRARYETGRRGPSAALEGSDLEREFRDRDSQRVDDQADQIVTFSTDHTVRPSDRCLIFQEAVAAASLTFPSAAAWGRGRSVLVRVSNRTGFALTIKHPTASFTVAAGLNCLAWTDGKVINGIIG
jgi:hypothetical protein